jgi:hypothetical protein
MPLSMMMQSVMFIIRSSWRSTDGWLAGWLVGWQPEAVGRTLMLGGVHGRPRETEGCIWIIEGGAWGKHHGRCLTVLGI